MRQVRTRDPSQRLASPWNFEVIRMPGWIHRSTDRHTAHVDGGSKTAFDKGTAFNDMPGAGAGRDLQTGDQRAQPPPLPLADVDRGLAAVLLKAAAHIRPDFRHPVQVYQEGTVGPEETLLRQNGF